MNYEKQGLHARRADRAAYRERHPRVPNGVDRTDKRLPAKGSVFDVIRARCGIEASPHLTEERGKVRGGRGGPRMVAPVQ